MIRSNIAWPYHKVLNNQKCIKGFHYVHEMIYLYSNGEIWHFIYIKMKSPWETIELTLHGVSIKAISPLFSVTFQICLYLYLFMSFPLKNGCQIFIECFIAKYFSHMERYIRKDICPQGIHSLVGKKRHIKTPTMIYNIICKKYNKNREGRNLPWGNLGRLSREMGDYMCVTLNYTV